MTRRYTFPRGPQDFQKPFYIPISASCRHAIQIEDFLREHEAVKDAAVIGLPDSRLGEIAAAIIELKPGVKCTEEEIAAFCASLPRYKRPRKIIFDQVPRNPTGKIEKPRLRERYGVARLVEDQTEK
jgi:long-chain acyl-CoA synthetase